MNASEFIVKWKRAELKERSAAQEHFIDLCRLIDHPTPAEADPTGDSFCFEKGAAKHGGGDGFADVWKKSFFGWEYKGKHKDLSAAYDQLLRYRDSLANPPLLVVCDLDRIVVHTNFTDTVSVTHELPLEAFGEARNLEILRAVFFDPEKLRPGKTSEVITREAAEQFAGLADSMRCRGLDSAQVAHFLDRLVFCQFAEDIGLLPDMIFSRIVTRAAGDSKKFTHFLQQLFQAMANGGEFGLESIRHFNGNLFDDSSVPDLTSDEIQRVATTAALDWSAVDPSIFGTLFERGLDPSKRSQLGAHFTGKQDIELLVDAVVMTPLRREWTEQRQVVELLLTTGKKKPGKPSDKPLSGPGLRKAKGESERLIHQFLVRLQSVKVLDPACGSGNFLYVTLQKLKDLEKEVILFSMDQGLGSFLPLVGPWQLHGIEINPYAHDLAQMTVWIGWLQWIKFNGFGSPQDPILRPMEGNFQCKDAILKMEGQGSSVEGTPAHSTLQVSEPEWPKVDFIVGNPPFLGDKMMRRELGDEYVEKLRTLYAGRIPGQSDLCCYWFEKARAHIEKGNCKRAGLLATQGIRGGANREVLKRIKETGDIFWAISDKNWILDGATVHVSMIGFDSRSEDSHWMDGHPVPVINSNLTSDADIVQANTLGANAHISFIGTTKKAPLDIGEEFALSFLAAPNPHGRPNSDVVRPWMNGLHVTRRESARWIIDYPISMIEPNAALYEAPFAYVLHNVKPLRENHREVVQAKYWWRQARPCPDMQEALRADSRYVATPRVCKHRIFAWIDAAVVPDCQLVAFARSDDYFFGVLHSRLHEVWALAQGTQLREKESGFRYTPTTCFETFPLPSPTPDQESTIAKAARELNELRERWLNPPEWTREEALEFPGTLGGPWDRYIARDTVEDRGSFKIGVVKYPRLVPRDESCAKQLAKRTLTNLYNQRPAWLDTAHKRLDAAVSAAYGWPPDLTDEQILERLLALNLEKAGKT